MESNEYAKYRYNVNNMRFLILFNVIIGILHGNILNFYHKAVGMLYT